MRSESITVCIPLDFTGRTVQNLVYKIQNLKSYIYITTVDKNINMKSIIGVLSLHLKKNDIVRITCYNDKLDIIQSDISFIENQISELINNESN